MTRDINSFVGDLVEMAKAHEELPNVRIELSQSQSTLFETLDRVATLEGRILAMKGVEESLYKRIRQLEVERDNAELRFLEVEERAATGLRFLAQIQGMAEQAEIELNLTRSEPVPDPKPMAEASLHTPQADPIPSLASPESDHTEDHTSHLSKEATLAMPAPAPEMVQPVPIPPSISVDTYITPALEVPLSTPVSEPTVLPPHSGDKYLGRKYSEVPYYVSLDNWLAEGGNEEDYHCPSF